MTHVRPETPSPGAAAARSRGSVTLSPSPPVRRLRGWYAMRAPSTDANSQHGHRSGKQGEIGEARPPLVGDCVADPFDRRVLRREVRNTTDLRGKRPQAKVHRHTLLQAPQLQLSPRLQGATLHQRDCADELFDSVCQTRSRTKRGWVVGGIPWRLTTSVRHSVEHDNGRGVRRCPTSGAEIPRW